jgi:transketolase C-terminal domain/subunit
MTVIGIPKFQHFFRASAGLRVDKSDLKRCRDFLNRKLYDMLVTAQATARANFRDIILPADLPITNGLQLCTHEYQRLDADIGLLSLLAEMEVVPPTDVALSEEAATRLPQVAGGLLVALAKTIRVLDPALESAHSADWEKAFGVMDLLI